MKTEKKKDINLFDYINQINLKKEDIKFDEKKCPPFMLVMNYGHENGLLEITNKINQYFYNLDPKLVYEYFYNKIPKGKRFTRWVKKDKIKDEKIKIMMNKYDISYREAYLSIF